MKDPFVSIGSFDRKNLFYGVKSFNRGQSSVDELVKEIVKYVASAGSTIIYCTTIKDVEQVYSYLPRLLFFFFGFNHDLFSHFLCSGQAIFNFHNVHNCISKSLTLLCCLFSLGFS